MQTLTTKPAVCVCLALALAVLNEYASGGVRSVGAIFPFCTLFLPTSLFFSIVLGLTFWHYLTRHFLESLCCGIHLRAAIACPQVGVWPKLGRYIGCMIWILGGAMAVYYASSLLRARGHRQVCILTQCALDKVTKQMVAGLLLGHVADLAFRVLGKMPPCAAPSCAAVLISRVL